MNEWRDWHKILFGVVCGLLSAGLILLVARQPQGTAIELAAPPTASPIQVYVVGAVTNPGVYQLPQGSRAEQAVQLAGGATENADLRSINLAAQLADGAKIDIPIVGETFENDQRSTGIDGVVINLNTASLDELMTLPGIGQERAEWIIKYREEHNGFKSIEEIQEVSGIGPSTFEKLRNLISVSPPQDSP